MTSRIDRSFTLDALTNLVRIDSRNPALEPGAPGEWEIARFVGTLLRDLSWKAEIYELTQDGSRRSNVIASRTGIGNGRSLMLNVHLDTVGVAGMREAFSGARRDGRIYGRGSLDVKGGVAAVLAMAKSISDLDIDLPGDVILAFVADEEHESVGTADVLRRFPTDAAIVVEPTDLDICVAHRGFGVFGLRTRGVAAHGGASDVGVDANLHMARLLCGLDELRADWQSRHTHPLLPPPDLHVPLVSGGHQLFMYADACEAHLECRTVPGQSAAEVVRDLEALIDKLGGSLDGFRASVEPGLWRSPWETEPDRPIVRALLAAATAVRGGPPRLVGHPWWEDSGLFGEAGIDVAVIGPAGAGIHANEEWVDAESVLELAEILLEAALTFGGGGQHDEGATIG